jgi:hypothetical protein
MTTSYNVGYTQTVQAAYDYHILMHVPRIFMLFLLQATDAQIYITIYPVYIIFTLTRFDTSLSSSGYSNKPHFLLLLLFHCT